LCTGQQMGWDPIYKAFPYSSFELLKRLGINPCLHQILSLTK
jgi:hypothetical protein